MELLKFAIKSLFAHKRRSIFTGAIMAISVIAINLTGGFINYTYEGLRESTIRSGLGHLQILPEDEQSGWITDWQGIEKRIRNNIPEVVTVAPRIKFTGLITGGEESFVFLGEGIDVEKEKPLRRFTSLREGRFFEQNDTFSIIVGKGLKELLKIDVGDGVTVLSTTVDGVVNAIDATVKGVVSTGVKEYDNRLLITPLIFAQTLLFTDNVTSLAILLDKTSMAEKSRDNIAKILDNQNCVVKTWSSLTPYYHQVVGLYNSVFYFICAILGLIIFAAVIGMLFLNYFERIGEIGIMRALGTPRIHIFKLFLYESASLALFSGVAGLVLSIILSRLINGLHILTPPPPGYSAGYLIVIYNEPRVMLVSIIFIIVISILAGIIPGIKGTKTNIVEAIRYV